MESPSTKSLPCFCLKGFVAFNDTRGQRDRVVEIASYTPKMKMSHPTIPSRVRERAIAAHRGARDQSFPQRLKRRLPRSLAVGLTPPPLPVEPKVSRIANAEVPSPLAERSAATTAGIAESQPKSPRRGTVASSFGCGQSAHSRMATNASAPALCTAGRRANESRIPIASVALGGASAAPTLGTVSVLPAVKVLPKTPRPDDISGKRRRTLALWIIDAKLQGTIRDGYKNYYFKLGAI